MMFEVSEDLRSIWRGFGGLFWRWIWRFIDFFCFFSLGFGCNRLLNLFTVFWMNYYEYLVIMIVYCFVNLIFSCSIKRSPNDVSLHSVFVDLARHLNSGLMIEIIGVLFAPQNFIFSYIDGLFASHEIVDFFGSEFVLFWDHMGL